MLSIFTALNGYKTYLAAAGLVGLALYQLSTGSVAEAFQTLMGALAAGGLKHAVSRHLDEVKKLAK
jgi:hypothetical protein